MSLSRAEIERIKALAERDARVAFRRELNGQQIVEPGGYREWRSQQSRGVRASGWFGTALALGIVCLFYSFPIYLLIAVFAGGITAWPNKQNVLVLLAAIFFLGFIPAVSRQPPAA